MKKKSHSYKDRKIAEIEKQMRDEQNVLPPDELDDLFKEDE